MNQYLPPAPAPGVADRFVLHRDPRPARIATFAEDVRTGLGTRPFTLSPKFFYDDLVGVITASPVVAAVLEGPNAIAVVRAMVGSTRPHEASEGSIRGDYALVGLRNLVHASDAPATAESEIKLWFPEGIIEYTRDIDRWMSEDKAPS